VSRAEEKPTLLTVSEVADMLRVSTMTVYRLVGIGEIPAVRIGRCVRIPRVEAEERVIPQSASSVIDA
jgi:excisionase family DNA binding protein